MADITVVVVIYQCNLCGQLKELEMSRGNEIAIWCNGCSWKATEECYNGFTFRVLGPGVRKHMLLGAKGRVRV